MMEPKQVDDDQRETYKMSAIDDGKQKSKRTKGMWRSFKHKKLPRFLQQHLQKPPKNVTLPSTAAPSTHCQDNRLTTSQPDITLSASPSQTRTGSRCRETGSASLSQFPSPMFRIKRLKKHAKEFSVSDFNLNMHSSNTKVPYNSSVLNTTTSNNTPGPESGASLSDHWCGATKYSPPLQRSATAAQKWKPTRSLRLMVTRHKSSSSMGSTSSAAENAVDTEDDLVGSLADLCQNNEETYSNPDTYSQDTQSIPASPSGKSLKTSPTGPKNPLLDYMCYRLDITLKEGRDLAIRDKSGTSDPYVKFKMGGKLIYKSRIVYKNLNPVWNEKFSRVIDDIRKPMFIKVYDHDEWTSDDFMGCTFIDLTSLIPKQKTELRVTLEDAANVEYLGYLVIELILIPKSMDEAISNVVSRMTCVTNQITQKKTRSPQWTSVINIVLMNGKKLLAIDENGFSDPYCKFKLGTEKCRSKAAFKTTNPKWMEQLEMKMFDDQTRTLEISLWSRNVATKDNFLGRCEIDLSKLKPELTHTIEQDLEDGAGELMLLMTITGTSGMDESDLDSYQLDLQDRNRLLKKFSIPCTLQSMSDVGHLEVKVIRSHGLMSADIGGKSDPFCVVELVNSKHQTQTIYKSLNPYWGKVFTINVKDIHSILEITVLDEDKNSPPEFLGKVVVPLLKVKNGERKWYALKDKKLCSRMKGSIMVEMDLIYNPVRAGIRTMNPKEHKYTDPEKRFKKAALICNAQRVIKMVTGLINIARFIQSCWAWESKPRSAGAFLVFILLVWNFEIYMLPLFLVLLFLQNYILNSLVSFGRAPEEDEEYLDNEDDDDDESEDEKKNKTFREKLQAVADVLLMVQNGLDEVSSFGERIKNTFNWTVPFISILLIILLTIVAVVLYWIPLRMLLLLWGINKFTKKLLRPKALDNVELFDILSRVPADPEKRYHRELRLDGSPERIKKPKLS